jgi:hypothetical protein
MNRLRQWRQSLGTEFAAQYEIRVATNHPSAVDLPSARRRVSHFASLLRTLCEQDLIDGNLRTQTPPLLLTLPETPRARALGAGEVRAQNGHILGAVRNPA